MNSKSNILEFSKVHGKNNFAEVSKIWLATDLHIILLDLKNNEQCCKKC